MQAMKLIGVALLACALCACDRDKPQSATGASGGSTAKGTIGISVLTMGNPFFKEIADAVIDEAKKSNFEVVVVDGDRLASKQYSQVKEFIARKVDAIILTPCDSKAVGSAIKEANAAGIPVFTADIASTAPDAKVVTHVATDNYTGGREAARAMIKGLNNRGKVAIVDYPEVESVQMRTKGFRDELAAQKSPIEIVASVNGRGSKEDGFKVTQDMLVAHRDLAGIFAINDPSGLGAYAAIEKAGLAGKIIIVAFDGQTEGKIAIRDGKIYADPIQFPDRIGRQTVQAIMKYLAGEKPQPEILIPTQLYYQADAKADASLPKK